MSRMGFQLCNEVKDDVGQRGGGDRRFPFFPFAPLPVPVSGSRVALESELASSALDTISLFVLEAI